MLIQSKRIFYAMEAVLYVAEQNRPVKATEIATALNVPLRYLEPSLQKLGHAGILRGSRGPHGGYILGMFTDDIDLCAIYDIAASKSMLAMGATAQGKSMLMPVSKSMLKAHREHLKTITIASLL